MQVDKSSHIRVKGFGKDQQIIALLLGGAILLIGLLRPFHPLRSICRTSNGELATQALGQWIVEVQGAVRNPGIYRFDTAPTPLKVIQRAGGLITKSLSPQAPSRDLDTGTRIEVQELDSESAQLIISPISPKKRFVLGIPIALNQAHVEDLAIVPGISRNLARCIVEFRESHGPFRRWNDLKRVKGVGPKNLESFKSYLSL